MLAVVSTEHGVDIVYVDNSRDFFSVFSSSLFSSPVHPTFGVLLYSSGAFEKCAQIASGSISGMIIL